MSKFSEALRKIEESRSQKKLYSFEENLRKSSRRDKIRTIVGYAVLLLGILLVVFSFVYDFGFNKVIRPPEPHEREPVPKVEMMTVKSPDPVEVSEKPLIPETYVTEPVSEEKVAGNLPAPAVSVPMGSEIASPVPVKTAEENTPIAEKKKPYYTIQLVTYQKKEPAEHEVKALGEKGFQAFILPDKKYYTVCVERFDTKAAASKRIAELKKSFKANTYQDSFIRFVK